jgi:hypothetical protein
VFVDNGDVGLDLDGPRNRRLAIHRFRDHLPPGMQLEDGAQAATNNFVIVGNKDACRTCRRKIVRAGDRDRRWDLSPRADRQPAAYHFLPSAMTCLRDDLAWFAMVGIFVTRNERHIRLPAISVFLIAGSIGRLAIARSTVRT